MWESKRSVGRHAPGVVGAAPISLPRGDARPLLALPHSMSACNGHTSERSPVGQDLLVDEDLGGRQREHEGKHLRG